MIREPRLIRSAEVEVLRATLGLANATKISPAVLASLGELRVFGGCTCGCASVDFVPKLSWEGTLRLAEGSARTERGFLVGVIVWGRPDALTTLEVFNYDGECSDAELPLPASIAAYTNPVQDFTR
jgi:hypothetical protein